MLLERPSTRSDGPATGVAAEEDGLRRVREDGPDGRRGDSPGPEEGGRDPRPSLSDLRARLLRAGTLVWSLLLVAAPAAAEHQPSPADSTAAATAASDSAGGGGPRALATAAWIGAGEVAYGAGLVISWERHDLEVDIRDGVRYATRPFRGPESDFECLPRDACLPGEISHYVTWTAMGALARLRGHDPLEAWLLSGVWGNWWWEYVVEGTFERPSGHDLVINAGSAAVGVAIGELIRRIADG